MTNLRKAFVISVSVMTIFSMSMIAVPFQAEAASAGDLIKIDGYAPVYYLGDDMKRYVFPNESTYFSWYRDFSSVVTLDQTEVEGYPLAANVVMRPGTNLVKRPVPTDPKVYAVEPNGTLRWVPDEATAVTLYGDMWAKRVVDVPDSFFVNYTISNNDVDADMYPAGSLVKYDGGTDVYYINEDGEARKIVDEAAFLANRFDWDDVMEAPAGMDMPAAGDDITGKIAASDTAQGGKSGTGPIVDPGAGSGLTVALSSQTAASASIPAGDADSGDAYDGLGGAALVPFTTVNFTAANDGDVKITGLTVERIGIGDEDELGSVYIYEGAKKISGGRSIASDDTVTFNFSYTVPAGETKSLIIRADIAENGSNGNHGFAIMAASDVETNSASVTGSFPVKGNLMSLTGVDAAGIVYKLSDGADLDSDLKVGEDEVELAEIKITEVNGEEDAEVVQITFEQKGSLDTSDLDNFYLTNSGDVVADDFMVDGDRITMMFDEPFLIENGDNETFELVADLNGGSTETIQFEIDDTEDVVVMGADYGYYASALVDGTAGTDDVTSSITIETGDLTITEDDTNPRTQDVAVGQDDVIFLAAKLEAPDEVITITELRVDVTFVQSGTDDPSTNDYLENLTLYLDGSRVAGPEDVALNSTDADVSITFEEEFDVFGEQVLTVEMDISDYANNGTYSVEIDSQYITAEDSNGDDIGATEITGTASGNNVQIGQDNPSVAKDSTLGNKTIVTGDENFEVARFILDSGDAEALEINKYTVDFTLSGVAIGDIEDLYVNEEDMISNPSDPQDFSVNETVAAGTEKIISVFLTIDSDATIATGSTIITSLSIDAEGDISGDDVVEAGFAGSTTAQYVTGQTVTVQEGDLTLALSSGTPDEDIIVAGSTNVPVAEFEFAAENVGFEITELTITARSASSTSAAAQETVISSMTVDGVTDSTNAGVAEINTSIRVDKDDETKVLVYANFNDDFDAISSGDDVFFHVSGYKYIADNDTSSEVEVTSTSVVTTETLAVYNTVPTVVAKAGDTTTLKTSDNEIMDIEVTADSRDDVTINALAVEITLTDDDGGNELATSSVELLDTSGDVIATGVYSNVGGVDTYTFTMTADNVIAAGDTETFTVNVNLSGVETDDSCEVSLIETGFDWSDDEAANITTHLNLIDDLDGSFEISK